MNSKIYFDNPIYVTTDSPYRDSLALYKLIQKSEFSLCSYIDETYVSYKLLQEIPHKEFQIESHESVDEVVRREFPEIFL